MEIKIDTNKDSTEHIRKIINFLENFIGDRSGSYDNYGSAPEASEGLFNIFNDDSPTVDPYDSMNSLDPQEPEEPEPDFRIQPYD